MLITLCIAALLTSTWSLSTEEQLNNAHGNTTILRDTRVQGWVDSPTYRGTASILWSCLITIVASIYTAIHPNIPVRRIPQWKQFLQKFKWVGLALLVPEFIVARTALRQYLNARKLVNYLNSKHSKPTSNGAVHDTTEGNNPIRKYSMAYGFWVEMGGFVMNTAELSDDDPVVAITAKGAIYLAECGHVFDISDEQIADRSKSNALGKILVCLQVSWMFLQCITRAAAGYPLTLLEIHTMVHVLFALILYTLWWHKPLDVDEPIMVDCTSFMDIVSLFMMSTIPKRQVETPELDNLKLYVDSTSKPERHSWLANVPHEHFMLPNTPNYNHDSAIAQTDHLLNEHHDFATDSTLHLACGLGQRYRVDKWSRLAYKDVRRWCLCTQALLRLEGARLTSLEPPSTYELPRKYWGTVSTGSTSNSATNRYWSVRSLSSLSAQLLGAVQIGEDGADESYIQHVWMAYVVMPVIYTGVHLSAISTAVFPTRIEAIFWYISAGGVGAASLLGLLLPFVLAFSPFSDSVVEILIPTALVTALVLSQVFRSFLLIESFVSLREVSLGVYIATPWLQAIPHI